MTTAGVSIQVRTPERVTVVDLTRLVRDELRRAGLRRGVALISVPHTTCGLAVNEDEAGLKKDVARLAARLLDPLEASGSFEHDRIDNNARAHLTSVLIGTSTFVPVTDGDLLLGTWQSLFLIEMDGPRSRRVDLTFLGE